MIDILPSLRTSTWSLSGQLSKDEPVRRVRLERNSMRVGRKTGNDLLIPCPSVSGVHAELSLDDNRLFVNDLGSTNGTFLNGVRIRQRCQVNHGDLLQFAQVVFRAGIESYQTSSQTIHDDAADRALALIQFDKLITDRVVAPHYQPIVAMDSRAVLGYELLGRSRLFGLGTPQAMFTAAAVLNMEAELSRVLRHEGVRHSNLLPGSPILFVNTHPTELAEPDLLAFSLRELREMAPNLRVVLEIHEKAITRINEMRNLHAVLRDLDFELAYDDFGAGQARLVELTEVPPEYLKFDMCLIRDIHQATPERQKLLGSLVRMVIELGVAALAEGVETLEEHQVCCDLGFTLGQGFYYGRPETPGNLK